MTDIPRRLSVHDEDYNPAIGARLVIFFDGEDQHGRAEGYDLEAGTVTRAKHDANGKIFCVGDEIAIETVHGKVEVFWAGPRTSAGDRDALSGG